MRIAVIGAGNVGAELGRLWADAGHEVRYGLRDPDGERARAVRAAGGEVTSIADAVATAEIVAVATPPAALASVAAEGGDWAGKIIVDATNLLGAAAAASEFDSAGEELAARASGARVVKAFNTIGANRYGSPRFGGEAASMLICGDDADAKDVVAGLASDMGFEVVDAGPLANSRLLESLAELWVTLLRVGHGRDIAFRLLRD